MVVRSSYQEAPLIKHIQPNRLNSSPRPKILHITIFLRCLNPILQEIRHFKTTNATQQTKWASPQLSIQQITFRWSIPLIWDYNIPSPSNLICLCLSLFTATAAMQLQEPCVTKAIKITTAFSILEIRTNTCSLLISTWATIHTSKTSRWRNLLQITTRCTWARIRITSTTSGARWASNSPSKVVLINLCQKRRASNTSKTHWLLMSARISFRFLLHLRWWGKKCPSIKFQCLTWRSLRLNQSMAKLPPRHAAPLDLPLAATATQMRKRLPSSQSLKAPLNVLANANPLSIRRRQPLTSTQSLHKREMSSRRAHGSVRSRPNCVGSGCKAFNARTNWRNRAADSLMDRRNYRRKRPWADSTSHRSVRIS